MWCWHAHVGLGQSREERIRLRCHGQSQDQRWTQTVRFFRQLLHGNGAGCWVGCNGSSQSYFGWAEARRQIGWKFWCSRASRSIAVFDMNEVSDVDAQCILPVWCRLLCSTRISTERGDSESTTCPSACAPSWVTCTRLSKLTSSSTGWPKRPTGLFSKTPRSKWKRRFATCVQTHWLAIAKTVQILRPLDRFWIYHIALVMQFYKK